MLEGFQRFGPYFPESLGDNERLLEVYTIRRTLERAVAAGAGLAGVEEREREILVRYFPEARTADDLRAAYEGFVAAADEHFRKLEEGDADEVALWRYMVEWSLTDFQSFYQALGITIDFVIGESFYLDAGNWVVNKAIDNGTAFEPTKQLVCREIAELDRAMDSGKIIAQARDKSVALLEKDIGAIVVPLPDGERLVVRRSISPLTAARRFMSSAKSLSLMPRSSSVSSSARSRRGGWLSSEWCDANNVA
jgi:arginyl-tRNA synthetase